MPKYTIATVAKVKNGHPWTARMEEGLKKFRTDTGHNAFLVGPPKTEKTLQVRIVEDLIAQKVDAICVSPILPESLELTLMKARRQGIVVICHEASTQQNIDYEIEAVDNMQFGAHVMDHLAKYMGQKGQYAVFLETLTAKSQDEWARAAIARQQEKYPEMRLAARKVEHHDDRPQTREKTRDLLATCPNLKGVLCLGEAAVEVVGEVVEEKRLQQTIAVVGTGLLPKTKRNLLRNAVKLLSLWDPAESTYVMNKLAVMVLNKEPITNGMSLGVPGYTRIKLAGKVLFGAAMLDFTKDNLAALQF